MVLAATQTTCFLIHLTSKAAPQGGSLGGAGGVVPPLGPTEAMHRQCPAAEGTDRSHTMTYSGRTGQHVPWHSCCLIKRLLWWLQPLRISNTKSSGWQVEADVTITVRKFGLLQDLSVFQESHVPSGRGIMSHQYPILYHAIEV